jgi:hypothetical protein
VHLIEPEGTVSTGDAGGEMTAELESCAASGTRYWGIRRRASRESSGYESVVTAVAGARPGR